MKIPQLEIDKAIAQDFESRQIEVAMYDLNIDNYTRSLVNIQADYPNGFDESEQAQNDSAHKTFLEGLLKDTRRERNIAYRTLQVTQQQIVDRDIDVEAMLALITSESAIEV